MKVLLNHYVFYNPWVSTRHGMRTAPTFVGALLGMLACMQTSVVYAAGLYDREWEFRQPVTIAGGMIEGELTNFPVLIQITNANNHIFGQAQPNGNDIVFTASDRTTKLSHEIQHYADTGTNALIAWVKVPLLPAGVDTTLYLYYGNAAAPDQQAVADVWADGFGAVWHMNELLARDSTSNAYHFISTSSGSTAFLAQSGKIGSAVMFNGDGNISAGSPPLLNMGPNKNLTVSFWFNVPNPCGGASVRMLNRGMANNSSTGFGVWSGAGACSPRCGYGTGSIRKFTAIADNTYADETWHYVTAVFDRQGDMTLYMNDGTDFKSYDMSADADLNLSTTSALQMGGTSSTTGGWLIGKIDEARICRTIRNEAWRLACYRNQGDPSAWITLGPERPCRPPGTFITVR
ncbi:MAG: DUF2341 domain-containing protein [Lentisphaerae bacterium]|nr:DUF2341 domain-containing protein [Lentisphaerota bacterium]